MCGRYALSTTYEALQAHFALKEHFCFVPQYNIAPGQILLTIVPEGKIRFMRWGFRPAWAQPDSATYNNARLETIREKASFKHSFSTRRCLIPASGYFEWKVGPRGKQPYYITQFHGLLAFAGIWEGDGVAILTEPALPELRTIHERAPVVVNQANYLAWLKNEDHCLDHQESPKKWTFYPVSTQVNQPSWNSSQCLMPLNDALLR